MDPAFKFQPGIGAVAGDDKIRFLDAPQLRFAQAHELHLPAPAFSIHAVHPIQGMGKQSAFLAAHAAANLHDDVFRVAGVRGQKQDLQLLFQLFHPGLYVQQLVLSHPPQFLVRLRVQQLLQIVLLGFQTRPLAIGGDDGLQFLLLLEQLGRGLGVCIEIRLGSLLLHLQIPLLHLFQLVQHSVSPVLVLVSSSRYSITCPGECKEAAEGNLTISPSRWAEARAMPSMALTSRDRNGMMRKRRRFA